MKKFTGPFQFLLFMRRNSVVSDTTHSLVHFFQLNMQVKTITSEASAILQPIPTGSRLTIPPRMTKHFITFVYHPSQLNATGTKTPVERFTKTVSLFVSNLITTIIGTNIALRVTNKTESPYTIMKNTQVADFSVVTPEQTKFIKPVDTTILNLILEVDPDVTCNLNELIKTNKKEKEVNEFCFSLLEHVGEIRSEFETPTPRGLQFFIKKKLNPKDNRISKKIP